MMIKCNWFDTLNEALAAEDLVEQWPLGLNIQYDETVRIHTEDRCISVTRDSWGMYERPVHYSLY